MRAYNKCKLGCKFITLSLLRKTFKEFIFKNICFNVFLTRLHRDETKLRGTARNIGDRQATHSRKTVKKSLQKAKPRRARTALCPLRSRRAIPGFLAHQSATGTKKTAEMLGSSKTCCNFAVAFPSPRKAQEERRNCQNAKYSSFKPRRDARVAEEARLESV